MPILFSIFYIKHASTNLFHRNDTITESSKEISDNKSLLCTQADEGITFALCSVPNSHVTSTT